MEHLDSAHLTPFLVNKRRKLALSSLFHSKCLGEGVLSANLPTGKLLQQCPTQPFQRMRTVMTHRVSVMRRVVTIVTILGLGVIAWIAFNRVRSLMMLRYVDSAIGRVRAVVATNEGWDGQRLCLFSPVRFRFARQPPRILGGGLPCLLGRRSKSNPHAKNRFVARVWIISAALRSNS